MDQQIKKFVNRLRLWIFVKQLVHALLWCMPAGLFLGAVLETVSCFVPWYDVHYWAAGAAAAGAAAAVIWALWRYPSAHKAALLLDRTGLSERTVTALDLAGDDSFLSELQKKDTWAQLSGVKFHKRLPWNVSWKNICLLAVMCVLFAGTGLLPSPARIRAKELHKVAEQAEAQIEKVEKAWKELEQEKKKQADAQIEEYGNMLEDIQKELKEADSQEALEKALERAEHKLNQAAEKTDNKSVKNRMKQLSLALNPDQKDIADEEKQKKSADMKAAQEMKNAAEEAEKLLNQLLESENLNELSQEELEPLERTLKELAKLSSDQELAESLRKAASQMHSGKADGNTLTAAQAAVSALKKAAGTQLASGGTEGQSGPGNHSGSGTGNGTGNGSGSGTGNGTGNGSGNGTGWNYGSKNGSEKEITYNGEMVSVPGALGDDENLTGRQNEGASYTSQGGASLTWSGNSVEYGQVIGEYSRQALSRISGSDYPAGVQDIIKSYFEQLNQ